MRRFTQSEVDELVERRIAKAHRHRRCQLDQLAQENDRLRAELDRLRHRTFIDRLIDLFRPHLDRRGQTDRPDPLHGTIERRI